MKESAITRALFCCMFIRNDVIMSKNRILENDVIMSKNRTLAIYIANDVI